MPRLPRTFTRQHGYQIDARDFPEWADVLQAVERVGVRRDLSAGWSESVVQMMRLALASREASEQLVDEYVVAELPRMRPAVGRPGCCGVGSAPDSLRTATGVSAGAWSPASTAWPGAVMPGRCVTRAGSGLVNRTGRLALACGAAAPGP
ncbi:hypothetical protein ABT099_24810 [Streptomyces prasinus]|uniref:hypothetical protein n=1 Tax=Streptomyces prasinus TaxID=67345 RepID=UPI0033194AB6